MKETLRRNIQNEYPEWHNNPLHLTIPEIKNPLIVIQGFFDCYNLPGIRACLRQWFEDALSGSGIQARDHMYTYYDVERLIEAIFVRYKKNIYDSKQKKKNN